MIRMHWLLLITIICLVMMLALVVPGYASSGPGAPKATSASGGPSHCWTGSDNGAPDPCDTATGGRPYDAVNLYTGNLTIWDTPAHYKSVGDAIPFTVFYNGIISQSMGIWTRIPLNTSLWSHSYNIYAVGYYGHAVDGVYIVEGNGWVHFFVDDHDGTFTAREGIDDILDATFSGGSWTGWRLTRPNNSKLYFNTGGELTSITDANGLTWTLSYTGTGATRRLSTITDPCNRVTTLSYTYYSGPNRYLLTGVSMPGGISAQFGYTIIYGQPVTYSKGPHPLDEPGLGRVAQPVQAGPVQAGT